MAINLMTTIKGSLLEGFFPKGWDLAKFDLILSRSEKQPVKQLLKPESWWNHAYTPVPCDAISDFDMLMGHEIAMRIRAAREAGWPDWDVSLGRIFPHRMEGVL